MPLYEFKCADCGNKFSEIRKIGDYNAVCPKCGSAKTEKMISSFLSPAAGKCSPSGGG